MRTLLVVLACLSISACGDFIRNAQKGVIESVYGKRPTKAELQKTLNSSIGMTNLDFVRAAGIPERTYDAGGHTFFAYKDQNNVTIPGSSPNYNTTVTGNTATTTAYGGRPTTTYTYTCEFVFESANDKIINYTYSGDGCTSD